MWLKISRRRAKARELEDFWQISKFMPPLIETRFSREICDESLIFVCLLLLFSTQKYGISISMMIDSAFTCLLDCLFFFTFLMARMNKSWPLMWVWIKLSRKSAKISSNITPYGKRNVFHEKKFCHLHSFCWCKLEFSPPPSYLSLFSLPLTKSISLAKRMEEINLNQ